MKTILIIDDDMHIGNMLQELLEREGYGVLRAYSGTEALLLLSQKTPDLVLLDLMLPGLSGEEVLPKIKNIPVIVVSAKIDVQDKVDLLLGGAADYVTKPFDTKELLARIAVALRSTTAQATLLCYDVITLNTANYTVAVGEIEVKLTRTEYAILKCLMQNANRAVSKSALLEHIALDTPDCTEGSLKIHVSNLRGKLRDVSGKDHIEAVWGIGFKLKK
ncbi:MAG: response regulator transcription factor [Clostridia bacterium]|nr:response regulator transcription factor [Clostridia bacterium]